MPIAGFAVALLALDSVSLNVVCASARAGRAHAAMAALTEAKRRFIEDSCGGRARLARTATVDRTLLPARTHRTTQLISAQRARHRSNEMTALRRAVDS